MNPRHRLLLLSSSRTAGTEFLQHARGHIVGFLEDRARRAVFLPYATVLYSHDEYTERVCEWFAQSGHAMSGLHRAADPVEALSNADLIVLGGGNTFYLLHELYRLELIEPLRRRVAEGVAYIGWSAGSNVACPTIRTTNDMPIIWPAHSEALALIPFQLNPHYTDIHPPGHQGETRDERLAEFTRLNPEIPVLGLREGSALHVEDGRIRLLGAHKARIFHGKRSWDAAPNSWLDGVLQDDVDAETR
ncbi:MAG: dipeptidase PepE [Gammaproteobacteria bacterium]